MTALVELSQLKCVQVGNIKRSVAAQTTMASANNRCRLSLSLSLSLSLFYSLSLSLSLSDTHLSTHAHAHFPPYCSFSDGKMDVPLGNVVEPISDA